MSNTGKLSSSDQWVIDLMISASKSAQMYRIACTPFQATEVLIRRSTLILTGNGSLVTEILYRLG
ncbi:hypothetical protein ABLA76_14460 [Xenorhabdus sp. SGI240]